MNSERLIGLAYVAERWHGGMRSRGYRLLSRIQWQPKTDRAARLQPREDWYEARQWAAHYTRLARRNPRLF
jgi:hypothetical protein